MKRNAVCKFWVSVGFGLCLTLTLGSTLVWGGPLRLKMTDGTSVEVPYYWEEGGQLKFEIPGGVAGVPKVQVASVQEVVVNREFDPEVMAENVEAEAKSAQVKMMQDLISASPSGAMVSQRLSPEESLQLLRTGRSTEASRSSREKVHGAFYDVQADFSEVVSTPGNGLMVQMRKVVTSRNDLRQNGFILNLYDGEGNVIQKQACQVGELQVDRKAMKEMGVKGRLFSLMASVRPDERIRRYEITVDRH